MPIARRNLAHALLTLAVAGGCSSSHGREGEVDAGTPPRADAAPILDAHVVAPTDSAIFVGDAHAPPPSDCAAQDAQGMICPEAICDGPDHWFWDGERCHRVDCGTCTGSDCGRGVLSREECEAAHAGCEPSVCRGTGGTWMWWAEECHHYVCGAPIPADCIVGRPVCDCGYPRRFDPVEGCVTDPTCPLFEPTLPEDLCRGTGGEWGPFCCHSMCGVRCDLDCAALACDCPMGTVFDELRGCIDGARCHERTRGETCDGYRTRCEGGTICCERCGGAGCVGPATCIDPVCDSDPRTDTCGNRDDVP